MMNRLNRTARLAGLFYLIIAVFGPIGMLYIPSVLIAPDDATTTAYNIMASETLFRIGFLSDSIVFLSEIVLVVLLYVLFKPVSETLSLAAAFSRLAMAVVQGINLLNHFYVLLLLSGASYLAVFEPGQLNALVSLFLDAHEYGAYIWGAFFGLHLLFLGYLVYKSGYFPRMLCVLLGALLLFAALGYLTDSLGNMVFPGNGAISMLATVFLVPGTLGELSLALWLLIKGVKDRQQAKTEAV
jgi:hypothetical protein